MPDKKYTISEKKIRLLYATVDAPIMDARIKITKCLKGMVNHTVAEEIYEILRQLNMKAPQAAIDEFLNIKK